MLLDGQVLRPVVAALGPGLGDALAPALLQEGQVRVGPAEEQHLVLQRRAAGEHREVLQHDGVGERAQDLLRGDAALHQVDDVGLGEDAALGRHVVQLRVVEVDGPPAPGGRPTLIMHLSMVAPVPDAHLSFIDGEAVFSPVFSSVLKMMIFAS
jgi:hypothetical protein